VVERAVEILQRANGDYNGDRVRAIQDLNNAETDLRAALRSDNESEPGAFTFPYVAPQGFGAGANSSQVQSDEMLADARTMLGHVIGDLQIDNHDYGGYRVRSIADVQQSVNQLDDALQSSDRNVVATAGLLDHAVAVLQAANQDYGGHRVAAIASIQRARADLTSAMQADRVNDYGYSSTVSNDWDMPSAGGGMSQYASNDQLRNVRAMLSSAIDNLQHDSHDYNGYRARAVSELQNATNEIDAALQTN
jgi:hypothetical protein